VAQDFVAADKAKKMSEVLAKVNKK
jgi:hypothetical protein